MSVDFVDLPGASPRTVTVATCREERWCESPAEIRKSSNALHPCTRGLSCLLVTLLASVYVGAQAPQTLPMYLTLRQALDIALANNSILRRARADLEQTSGQYEQARSTLLPQFGIAARQGYETVNPAGFGLDVPDVPTLLGPFGSMDARVFVVQDLVNIASLRSWRSFRSRRDASRFLVGDAREVVTLNVVSAYLQALRGKASREALSEQTKLANELYEITLDRSSEGVASDLDAIRAKQQVNSLRQELQEAEQSYVAAKLNLANILQTVITSEYEVADPAAYGAGDTADRQATLQAAFTNRADYRAASAAVEAARLEIKSIEATRLPVLRVRADDGPSGISPANNVNVYSVTGSVTVPLFTGGRIAGEVHQAKGVLDELTATLDETRAQIQTDALLAISGVEWALKQLETSAENAKLSREEVDLARVRFEQGISDNTEVVNAQDRLSKADDARIRAQYSLGLARANLARAIGSAEQTYRK